MLFFAYVEFRCYCGNDKEAYVVVLRYFICIFLSFFFPFFFLRGFCFDLRCSNLLPESLDSDREKEPDRDVLSANLARSESWKALFVVVVVAEVGEFQQEQLGWE